MQPVSRISLILLSTLLICSQGSLAEVKKDASALGERDVERTILLAIAAQKRAASVGGEWRDVQGLIKSARMAMWSGKLEQAMELATKAKKQGKLGYEQAIKQSEMKMPKYLQEEEFGSFWGR